jgi:hypothetical protein
MSDRVKSKVVVVGGHKWANYQYQVVLKGSPIDCLSFDGVSAWDSQEAAELAARNAGYIVSDYNDMDID